MDIQALWLKARLIAWVMSVTGLGKAVQVPWVKFSYETGFILRVNLN